VIAQHLEPGEQPLVGEYRPGKLHGSFRFSYPDRKKPMTVRLGRVWRAEVEQLLASLGAGAPGQPAPAMAPAYQPQPGYQQPQEYQAPPR
jgi:hypothetical protein